MRYLLSLLILSLACFNAHATTSSTDPRFTNVLSKPSFLRVEPTLVRNRMAQSLRVYSAANWVSGPVSSPFITWGGDVDSGDWFEINVNNSGNPYTYVTGGFAAQAGETWILSFTVDSKSGTFNASSVALVDGCVALANGNTATNPPVGRQAYVWTLTTGGSSCHWRLGIGVVSFNSAVATARFSNVMLEKVTESGRTYPYLYVPPGDTRVFNHTYTATLAGGAGLITNEVGPRLIIPANRSTLVVGDSICSDSLDFAYKAAYELVSRRNYGIAYRCANGDRLDQSLTRLHNAFAETGTVSGTVPWTTVAIESGINDVLQGADLATMQTRLLTLISAVREHNARPVLMTIGPWNAASGAQNTLITSYNTWIKSLGLPVLDKNLVCNNGSNLFATKCTSSDGLHPGGETYGGGQIIGQAFLDFLRVLP
jgi:hypothetical protein